MITLGVQASSIFSGNTLKVLQGSLKHAETEREEDAGKDQQLLVLHVTCLTIGIARLDDELEVGGCSRLCRP